MEFLAIIVVVSLAAAAATACYHLMKPTERKLPPGPYPLPIVGSIFNLAGANPHKTFDQLSKKYGPLMSIRLGSLLTVVASSPETAKQVLSRREFTSRREGLSSRAHGHNKISMVLLPASSQRWKQLRRISKDQLFAIHSMEKSQRLRLEKVQQLLGFVQKRCDAGRVVNIRDAGFTAMLNVMSATFFSSEDVEFDSGATAELKEIMEGVTTALTSPSYADYFPILKPFDPLRVEEMSDLYVGRLLRFINHHIDQRLQSKRANPNDPKPNDFLETLLDISLKATDDNLTLTEIAHLLLDLYIAGTDTTSTTIEWVMTELLSNPHMLSKAKNEVRNVLGNRKIIPDEDIPRLPYLEAVTKEVFRCHPPAPLLFPRIAKEDTEINGYFIPKGSQLIVNMWSIGKDRSVWTNPDSFDPDRFLDNNNIDFKGQSYQLIPFGSGKRICPGMPFAQRIVPSVVAALIHNFDWEVAPGEKERNKEVLSGLVLRREASLIAIPMQLSS